jgi:hypothetical protein
MTLPGDDRLNNIINPPEKIPGVGQVKLLNFEKNEHFILHWTIKCARQDLEILPGKVLALYDPRQAGKTTISY